MTHLSNLQAAKAIASSRTKSFFSSSDRLNDSTQTKRITSGIKDKNNLQSLCFESDRPLVTIEFAPDIHPLETEYNYPHPQFVFDDKVINKFNPSKLLTVCALELIEHKTPSGLLLKQPYWKYKVDDGSWYEESVLIRHSDTCAKCPYSQDYNDERGRGWCSLFDNATRKHHQRTNDCNLNSSSMKALPYSEFDYGNLVKIIDPDKDHTEWATFKGIEIKHNPSCYSSTDSYLNEPEWYYLLSPAYEDMWAAETDICHADLSHTVATEELF